MIVGCLVEQDGKVLMARRNIEPRKGFWNLPCGFLENNETAAEGAIRETWEECLAKVEIDDLHCVYDLVGVHQVYLIFNAHMINDSIGVTTESSEVTFMSPDEIPWDDLAFASSKFALKKWIESNGDSKTKVHLGSFHKFASSKKASEKDE
ncbi:MAG: ADP-ribose pyrophosphatase YjhB (NUDIX family) [Bacteroidia bacterium]|jgi:ADP-ribose pyrophosphatase YjhB (NUDIX family)